MPLVVTIRTDHNSPLGGPAGGQRPNMSRGVGGIPCNRRLLKVPVMASNREWGKGQTRQYRYIYIYPLKCTCQCVNMFVRTETNLTCIMLS